MKANKFNTMKRETKENIFNYIIYILENFYTEDFTYLKWWGCCIFYPFFIIKNVIITPFLIISTPILYCYFIRIDKINTILQQINSKFINIYNDSE